jgi:hypothetical protein
MHVRQAYPDAHHMIAQGYETQLPQPGSDITITTLHSLLEAAETAGAAANVLVFLLLKASPADELRQVSTCRRCMAPDVVDHSV